MEDGHTTACELLGVEIETGTDGTRSGRKLATPLHTANDGRAPMISLGIILGAQEAATSTASWRHVRPDTARCLSFLAEQGYPLPGFGEALLDVHSAGVSLHEVAVT